MNNKVEDVKLYINGEFVEAASGETFENRNPFTNETINLVAKGNQDDIDLAVSVAEEAFRNDLGDP